MGATRVLGWGRGALSSAAWLLAGPETTHRLAIAAMQCAAAPPATKLILAVPMPHAAPQVLDSR